MTRSGKDSPLGATRTPTARSIVVDVKTDHVTHADLIARTAEHRAQGGAYALAVARATGRPVRAVELVFAALGGDAVVFEDVGPLAQEAERLAVGV